MHATPTLTADGTLYVGSYDHTLRALDAATGGEKWPFVTGDKILSSPAVGADGTAYVGSYDGVLHALE